MSRQNDSSSEDTRRQSGESYGDMVQRETREYYQSEQQKRDSDSRYRSPRIDPVD